MERDEAANLGLKKYWTGRMCVNGHVTWRYTASGGCQDCITDRNRNRNIARPLVDHAAKEAEKQRLKDEAAAALVVRQQQAADVNANTEEIFLNVPTAHIGATYQTARAACAAAFPGYPEALFEPLRRAMKHYPGGVTRITVKVPKACVASFYAMGEQLLKART